MLISTLRVNETVIIDDEILITITRIRGNQVHLGITAPKTKSVQREKNYRPVNKDKHLLE